MAGELGFDTGPFVNVAAFCERVLQEKDNVLSAIRIIDQINVQAQGEVAPEDLPAGSTVQSTLLVMLKAGEARGPQTIQINIEDPSGSKRKGPERSVLFSAGPAGGVSVIIPLMIQLSSAGLYWADILINRRLVSRVPLTIAYTFMRGPGVGPQQS